MGHEVVTMSETGKDRTCRACGASFVYPAPASLATKRLCASCAGVPEPIRRVLEAHQLEIQRLRRQVERLGGKPEAKPAKADGDA